MRDFHALAIGGEEHGVVTHDIAAAERVHADFARLARADVAEAAVGDVVLPGGAGFLVEDFQNPAGSAGRRVDLVLVMHLGDLDVEAVLGENARGVAGEPEKRVHADGVVRGVNDGDRFGGFADHGAFLVGVAGGADDQAGAVFQGGLDERGGEGVDGEIDGAGGFGEGGVDVLAGVMGGGDGHARPGGGLEDGLAHAAGDSCDEKIWHVEWGGDSGKGVTRPGISGRAGWRGWRPPRRGDL